MAITRKHVIEANEFQTAIRKYIKDADLVSICLAANECYRAMGEGADADNKALCKLTRTFSDKLHSLVSRIDDSNMGPLEDALYPVEDAVTTALETAVDRENNAHTSSYYRNHGTYSTINGHAA